MCLRPGNYGRVAKSRHASLTWMEICKDFDGQYKYKVIHNHRHHICPEKQKVWGNQVSNQLRMSNIKIKGNRSNWVCDILKIQKLTYRDSFNFRILSVGSNLNDCSFLQFLFDSILVSTSRRLNTKNRTSSNELYKGKGATRIASGSRWSTRIPRSASIFWAVSTLARRKTNARWQPRAFGSRGVIMRISSAR